MSTLRELLYHAAQNWDDQKTGPARARAAYMMAEAMGWPSTVTAKALLNGVNKLRKAGNGPATVNRKLSALRQALTEAYGREFVEAMHWPWQKEPPGRVFSLNREHQDGIRAALESQTYRNLFDFLLDTGVRLGEALGLTWGYATTDEIILTDTKNGGDRVVPVRRRALAALRAQAHIRDMAAGPFVHVDPRDFRREFKHAAASIGISDPQCVPHALRHTFITEAIREGIPIPVVQLWVGHQDIKTTMRYAHPNTEDLREAARRLDR